jgi:glutamate N-acetyltransferase/amino-acid N-acetyltransferase
MSQVMMKDRISAVEVVAHDWTAIEGGITAPRGYQASGVFAGIRKVKKDLALIVSEVPATVAAVFTKNKVVAAPLVVDKLLLERGNNTCRAILVNSGNANACTGERGMIDAWAMVQKTAAALGINEHEVLVSSTGVIGQFLPIEKIEAAIPQCVGELSENGSDNAALAIMTTDTAKKEIAVEFVLGGKTVRIGAIAKGSGMIAPNMATMLAFVTTDAAMAQPLLHKTFAKLVDKSFNRITVDGDTSTNDMAVMLANGQSGVTITDGPEFEVFTSALDHVLVTMAKMIARDGEGATKLIEVNVGGAVTEDDAVKAAQSIANSNLVKTAMHGEDANWGRIISAVGYSGIEFNPEAVSISFGNVPVLKANYEIVLDEALAKEELAKENITINVDLGQGNANACFWTCDLTKDYVHINASYRS